MNKAPFLRLRSIKTMLPLAVAIGIVSACSSGPDNAQRPRLADIAAFDRSILQQETAVTEQQLAQLYQDILQLQPAPETRQKIQYRLSQMHTAWLDSAELSVDGEKLALQQLVEQYLQLLTTYPDDPNNELLRYQLARSYDLLGEQAACLEQLELFLQFYPRSDFAPEVWFRKADIHYSHSHYADALDAYQQVLQFPPAELTPHARYMAGWSHFKLQQFALADEQFLRVLDLGYRSYRDTEQQDLTEEALKTLSLSLSYQQQGESLQALLQRVDYPGGERPLALAETLYRSLAGFLMEKQLYSAALDTYRRFISDYPTSLSAARMQLLLIEFYLSDADAQAAQAEQQHYIALFAPGSPFWQEAGGAERREVAPLLLQYLDYFSRRQYQQAQQSSNAIVEYKVLIPLWQQMLTVLDEPQLELPADVSYSIADLRFLLAQSLEGAEDYPQALALYTELGYQPLPDAATFFTAQDAAYKALLLAEKQAQGDEDDMQLWQQQTDFVRLHSSHPAAQQVALVQLQLRYNSGNYAAVLEHSSSVINWPHSTQSNAGYVLEARFLHSQSELALQHYASAEHSIRQLLDKPNGDAALSAARRSMLTEQLASSIYQQAQLASQNEEKVAHLQRLQLSLPDSAYHEAAAFEQMSLAYQAASYTAAISLLQSFIERYPATERTESARAMLLDSYEQTGQWDKAAQALLAAAARTGDEQQQREALYLAAQYQLKAGNSEQALDHYRSYANRYPLPHLIAQEARQQLVELYQQRQDTYRRNFWLAKIAEHEQQYRSQGNARSQQLASAALLALGRHDSELFGNIALKHPLSTSLRKKQQHMTSAIRRYEQSMQYGIAGLFSEAQFRVAQLYQQMAQAILQSERPRGLDELALEEYNLLLEEQAYPFEEQAIAIFRQNTRLAAEQLWDDWIVQSFAALARLLPAEFDKTEQYREVANDAF